VITGALFFVKEMCGEGSISRWRILCLAARVVFREQGVPLGGKPYLNTENGVRCYTWRSSNDDSPNRSESRGNIEHNTAWISTENV